MHKISAAGPNEHRGLPHSSMNDDLTWAEKANNFLGAATTSMLCQGSAVASHDLHTVLIAGLVMTCPYDMIVQSELI